MIRYDIADPRVWRSEGEKARSDDFDAHEMRDWRTANKPTLALWQTLMHQTARYTNWHGTSTIYYESFRADVRCGRISWAECQTRQQNQCRSSERLNYVKRPAQDNESNETSRCYHTDAVSSCSSKHSFQ